MSRYFGDFAEDYATLEFMFSSRRFTTGVPFTLAGTPSLAVYAQGSLVQSTAGVTLTVDYDGVTGLNHVLIDLSADAFYAVGKDYDIVIAVGTVDSVSVIGEVIGKFSIQNRWNGVVIKSIDANAINAAALAADTGLKPLYTGSVTSGSATTYVMSGVTAADDDLNGYRLRMTSGAMIGQIRMVKDWIVGTTSLELDVAFSSTLSAADTFVIEPAQVNVKHVNDVLASGAGTVDANVTSLAASVITAASIATDAIGADEIAAAGGAKIADIMLRRTQTNVEASSDGDAVSIGCLYGLIQQAQESNSTATPGSLTIYKLDGTTVLGTKVLSTNAAADPVDGIS